MGDESLSAVAARTASEVCERFEVGPSARALLSDGMTPAAFLDALLEKKDYPEAARFLAFALPKPEAVWWACLCAREAKGGAAPDAAAAFDAATAWVKSGGDAERRAAMPAAEKAGFATAAGCAALAAHFSGGSMGAPEDPPIPPDEALTARLVMASVALAAAEKEQDLQGGYRAFVERGLEVARRRSRWE